MPKVEGTTTEKYAGLVGILQESLDSGGDVGASVAVIDKGDLVVDIWGGYADAAKTAPWNSDTIVNVWSTTKTMTFVVALMLADHGGLDFHAPVAKYWPEFAANGKESIEVRHLMGHTSGLSGWGASIKAEDLADWEFCTSALAAQEPWWTPGTASGYHALTQGYLIGEVVRRITGTTIGQFFQSEVANVLDADFHIGLPESDESRVSFVIPPPPIDFSNVPTDSIAYRTFTSPALDPTMTHERWWRSAEIPAANGHGNARSVATIQQIIANRGEANGHRFFSEQTSDSIFETQAHGVDLALGQETHFGMGYGLASATTPLGPRACYWGGYGGSVIIMDQDAQLTVAYMMNKMQASLSADSRGTNLALHAALASLG
jgi:CubicO group peptidase (beta-lactamase class C family)